MNFKMILTVVFVLFAQMVCAARLGGKGNMRGILTRFSGLSPRQMILGWYQKMSGFIFSSRGASPISAISIPRRITR